MATPQASDYVKDGDDDWAGAVFIYQGQILY